MLNRNKIFKTVRDTTNTLNVLTSKKMDNVYTELMTYEDMVQKKYDKIKNLLNSLKYHHNKIEHLNKNYNNAIFGGGKTDLAKLMKDIDSAIDSIDILIGTDGILAKSKFTEFINNKKTALETELGLNTDKISKNNVKQDNKIFFDTASKELTEIKREFDENKRYINDLVEKIKKIEDPINQYILDRKLSKDFRQSIKNGIRDLSKLIDDNSKTELDKFNTYKNNITTGLAYARAAEEFAKKLETDPNASDDVKILELFSRNKDNLEFIFDNLTRGYLIGIKSNKILFEYSYKENTYNEVIFKNTHYIKKIYVKIGKSETNPSPSKYYFLDFDTLHNIYNQTALSSYVSDIYNKLTDFNILLKEAAEDTEQQTLKKILDVLVDNKIFSTKLLNIYKNQSEDFNINDLKNLPVLVGLDKILKEELGKILKEELGKFTKQTAGGGEKEKEEAEAKAKAKDAEEKAKKEKLKSSVNTTLEIFKKIKKQIEEDYDKEHNLSNQPQNPNKQGNITNTIKSTQTMLGLNEDEDESKFTNSIISSIIENYEKERSSVNTIEDKIKLDTKFVDILDNLGLNLTDIFKINFEDKLAFIFFILILHIVVYSIVESLIMNDYLTDIVYIMAVYVGVYFLIMFILILILNKYVNYRMKSALNYLNTDFNMQLITMHLFIVFMFYIIVLILSQHIDIFTAKDEDDKLQILYRIEVISSIIFIFSGVFIMLL